MKKTKPKKPEPEVMSGDALKASLEKLYGSVYCQSPFARLIDVGDRTVRSWISGEYPVPKSIAMLVNLMLKTKTKPDELRAT